MRALAILLLAMLTGCVSIESAPWYSMNRAGNERIQTDTRIMVRTKVLL